VTWVTHFWQWIIGIGALGVAARALKWLVDVRKSFHEGNVAKEQLARMKSEEHVNRCYEKVKEYCEIRRQRMAGFVIPKKPPCPAEEKSEHWDAGWKRYYAEVEADFKKAFGVSRMPTA
jgi:hypothetical protein